jgi:hypothetical protein
MHRIISGDQLRDVHEVIRTGGLARTRTGHAAILTPHKRPSARGRPDHESAADSASKAALSRSSEDPVMAAIPSFARTVVPLALAAPSSQAAART